jgi:hypothetical protein
MRGEGSDRKLRSSVRSGKWQTADIITGRQLLDQLLPENPRVYILINCCHSYKMFNLHGYSSLF